MYTAIAESQELKRLVSGSNSADLNPSRMPCMSDSHGVVVSREYQGLQGTQPPQRLVEITKHDRRARKDPNEQASACPKQAEYLRKKAAVHVRSSDVRE